MIKLTFKQTILHSYLIICDLVKVAPLLGVLKDTEVIGNWVVWAVCSNALFGPAGEARQLVDSASYVKDGNQTMPVNPFH